MFPNWLTDVQIETAPVAPALEDVTARGVLWQAAPNRFLLDAPDVARYLVEYGRRLTIERVPAADEEQVARFARMVPLAALLYQRGLLAFHAAAVAPPFPATDGAILLAGDSGAGKSTLLAALLQRGWRMLSDELSVIDLDETGRPVVFPVHPEILLWDDTLQKLNLEHLQELKMLIDGERAFSAAGQFVDSSLPLRAVYWLAVRSDSKIEIEQIRGKKFFQGINALLYNSHVADALLERGSHFRLASALMQSVTLHRMCRPRGQWSLDELANRIEAAVK